MARMDAKDRFTSIAHKMGKSPAFARVFFGYCVSNVVFWPAAFVLLHPRLRGDPQAVPY